MFKVRMKTYKLKKLGLSYIFEVFLNFSKSESQYSYKLYSYKKSHSYLSIKDGN